MATKPSELFAEWSRALVRGKAGELTAFHADSNDSVVVWSAQEAQTGPAHIRRGYKSRLDRITWESASVELLAAQRVQDIAWGTFRMQAISVHQSDGRRDEVDLRASFVLRRSASSWRIVLLHVSD